MFEAARQFPRHTLWRRAHISGDKIIIQCPLEEIGQYHQRDLTEDVATANAKYRAYIAETERKKALQAEAAEQERARIEQALGGLKFPPR